LLLEIARCPVIADWYGDPAQRPRSPCHRIIDYQLQEFGAATLDRFQLPEPWRGHLEQAPLLFVSSNPSIGMGSPDVPSEEQGHPGMSWDDSRIASFFVKSFDDWIVDGAYGRPTRPSMRRGKYVRFWGGILKLARELHEQDVRPGNDYALTEVVHCKSQREIGVNGPDGALVPCAERYLKRVLAVSGARVIVVLGATARWAVTHVIGLPDVPGWGDVLGPVSIGERARLMVFLPHPNAHMPRTFGARVAPADLVRLRAALPEWIAK
jgi:hypothetical protein